MRSLIFLFFLALPPLLMWWMLRVQRRVRERMRGSRPDDSPFAATPGYVDEVGGAGGLSYGRASDATDLLMPNGPVDEPDGIKAIQGRR